MPTIITPAPGGGLGRHNPDHDAAQGRWCRPPQTPDRCYRCYDPETLAHYPAEGYYEQDGWRYGCCQTCRRGGSATWPSTITITVTLFYCNACPHEAPTAAAAAAHLATAHPGLLDWLRERLPAELVELRSGAPIWYWAQEQDPAQEGWRPALHTGWGGKDGRPVADVVLPGDEWRWGWAWQILPRTPGESAPTARPAELTGG